MKVLLHICCGPCSIVPLRFLRGEGHDLTGCYANPNIHPYREFLKRLETLESYASRENLPLIVETSYPMESFLRQVACSEQDRCRHCYEMRLGYAAYRAKEEGYDGFSSTLLYSRYQKHDLIRAIGEDMARKYGLPFVYRDFRIGWTEGVETSKALGMYRQPYCGCIYSEKERYWKPENSRSPLTR